MYVRGYVDSGFAFSSLLGYNISVAKIAELVAQAQKDAAEAEAQEGKPTDPMRKGKPLPKAPPKLDIPDELKIKHFLPSTATHFARIVVHETEGDYVMALKVMRPDFDEVEYATYARFLYQQPSIRRAVTEEYEKIGRTEKGVDKVIGAMMKVVVEKPESRAAAVFGPVLLRVWGVAEQNENAQKPTELKIVGLESGLKRMTENVGDAQSATGFEEVKAPPKPEVEE